jgi:hypothetical protein
MHVFWHHYVADYKELVPFSDFFQGYYEEGSRGVG